MASAMNHTMQTCQHLCIMTQTQMMEEDKVDPFPARTTAELEEMLRACRNTKEILERESLIYSKMADFSKYSDQELLAMNAFVRESSRLLSIILAGGTAHFWTGQVTSTLQELKNMYHYVDDKVKDFLMLDKIMDTLDFKIRYGGHQKAAKSKLTSKSTVLATHPELLAFTALDGAKGATSQDSLIRIAEVCEKFSVQCRAIAQTRVEKMEDRSKKVAVREQLLNAIDEVLPLLRQHVLRIGLSKSQLKETPGNAAKSAGAGPGTHAHKITSLFSHKAVEEAHRTVEDCRERLMQEQLFRRAKVERRLAKEEELEKMGGGSKTFGQQLLDMPAYAGTGPGGDHQYRNVKGKQSHPGHHGHGHGEHGHTAHHKSTDRSHSPGGFKGEPHREASPQRFTSQRGESPNTLKAPRSPANRDGSPSPRSRDGSPSPRGEAKAKAASKESPKAKAASKGGTKSDAGNKAGGPERKASPKAPAKAPGKDDGSRESSPAKSGSPKARGRK